MLLSQLFNEVGGIHFNLDKPPQNQTISTKAFKLTIMNIMSVPTNISAPAKSQDR